MSDLRNKANLCATVHEPVLALDDVLFDQFHEQIMNRIFLFFVMGIHSIFLPNLSHQINSVLVFDCSQEFQHF
jgi:hypothetical protein